MKQEYLQDFKDRMTNYLSNYTVYNYNNHITDKVLIIHKSYTDINKLYLEDDPAGYKKFVEKYGNIFVLNPEKLNEIKPLYLQFQHKNLYLTNDNELFCLDSFLSSSCHGFDVKITESKAHKGICILSDTETNKVIGALCMSIPCKNVLKELKKTSEARIYEFPLI